jgi:pyridoxine 5-phosphate synthase
MNRVRLGVNIDHVATLRNARGSPYPDPVRAARAAVGAGADIVTAHLREDRRHIRDEDVHRIAREPGLKLNLEMAATAEMLRIALETRPHASCLVPERREELTTEGGLDAAGSHNHLAPIVRALAEAGIRVSLFIAPEQGQIEAAASLRVPDIELHTGAYCDAVLSGDGESVRRHLAVLQRGARVASALGLEVHAGHGLTYENVGPVAAIPGISELQIGHFLVGEAVFVGLEAAVRTMRKLIDEARTS